MAKFRPKILVVDDETEARNGLALALESKGYEVVVAATGQEALDCVKSEWPALIVLDVVLPDLPGTEVLKHLQADPITKTIPVLLLTAKPDVVKQISLLSGKPARYSEKPARPEALLQMVQEMLAGRRASA